MRACLDHDRQASGRLKLNTQFPYLLNARLDQVDWRPDGCIWIVILAYVWAHPDWNPRRPDGCINLPLFELWKENLKLIDHWSSSGRAAEKSGRMEARTEASRCSEGSGRKSTSSGWMMLGLSGRPDGMARRPDGWNSGQMSVQTGCHGCPDG
jgi:hypothetical protein